MALTAEQVESIIDQLELAMASGSASVSIDGRTVQYRSMSDIVKALTYFRTKLAQLNGAPVPRPLFRRINMGGGYQGTSSSPDC